VTHISHQQIERLIDEHGAALVLYARQWCSDPDDAVQEAFIELLRSLTVPDDPTAWLFTTTKRRAMNQTRGESRRRNRNKLANGSTRETTAPWFTIQLEKLEEAQQLQQQLELLEPLEREIVVAHVWGELTFAQIAALVDVSSSAAHRHYQTALAKLKLALKNRHQGTANNHKPKQAAVNPPPTEFLTQFSRANL
jgi:RNA polymerase sigma factor (sigma-70 family)